MVTLKTASGLTGITGMSDFAIGYVHVNRLMESCPLQHGQPRYDTSVGPIHLLD